MDCYFAERVIKKFIGGIDMRRMTDGHTVLNITRHVILRNFWEYYFDDTPVKKDVAYALVMGGETEYGAVYLPEVAPYIMSDTTNLEDLAPATGWRWED